jgi:hypothetical protein
MPSYKATGGNKAKLLWELHRSTMGDVLVFGCGQIRQGEREGGFVLWGAYSGRNPACGVIWNPGQMAMSRQNWTIYPGGKNSTIPQSIGGCLIRQRIGRGTETRLCLRQRIIIEGIFDAWGGGQAWPIGDRAAHFDGSAQSYSLTA